MTKQRVLVIEDELVTALDLQLMLSHAGFEVIGPVANIEDAMRAVLYTDLDAVVADANLNGRHVGGVAAALSDRGVPMVVVSGYEPRALPLAVANSPYLAKPFTEQQLVTTVRSLCRLA